MYDNDFDVGSLHEAGARRVGARSDNGPPIMGPHATSPLCPNGIAYTVSYGVSFFFFFITLEPRVESYKILPSIRSFNTLSDDLKLPVWQVQGEWGREVTMVLPRWV